MLWAEELFVPASWSELTDLKHRAFREVVRLAARRGIAVLRRRPLDVETRELGTDWPLLAQTMIGLRRLDNVQWCVETALAEGVPGDLIETGVWRGGATILMRGILEARGDTRRRVWVADSFAGLHVRVNDGRADGAIPEALGRRVRDHR